MIRRTEIDGRPVEQWDTGTATYTRWDDAGKVAESRQFTAGESAAFAADAAAVQAEANGRTLEDRARAALAANAAFLAVASPSNTQIIAQVRRLTKECSALIRLAIRELGDITDAE